MLYVPKWEQQTKVDPLSLPAFIAWLETKPPNKTYCYTDCGRCLAAQYYEHVGLTYAPQVVCLQPPPAGSDPSYLIEWVACGNGKTSWTFAAALARARALPSAE